MLSLVLTRNNYMTNTIISKELYKTRSYVLLDKCVEIIEKNIFEGRLDNKRGMLGGMGGAALFLSQLCDYISYDKYNCILNLCISHIYSNTFASHSRTLCDGSTGICWILRQLYKEDKLEIDEINEFLSVIDEVNYQAFLMKLFTNDFDYLHGAIGIAHYLLNFNIHTKEVCELVTNRISDHCIKDGNTYKIQQQTYVSPRLIKTVYNLGMSHGMASIIVVLCEIYNISKNDTVRGLLEGLVNYYLLIYENRKIGKISLFPSWIPVEESESVPESRLAWCYGDVGVFFALNTAAETLNDSHIKYLALKVADHSAQRMEDTKEWCFCHGSSGLYYMFNKMYKQTGNTLYRKTALKWLGILLDSHQITMETNLSVLQGISGVGLSLVNYLFDGENDWDKALLL